MLGSSNLREASANWPKKNEKFNFSVTKLFVQLKNIRFGFYLNAANSFLANHYKDLLAFAFKEISLHLPAHVCICNIHIAFHIFFQSLLNEHQKYVSLVVWVYTQRAYTLASSHGFI